MSAPDVSVVLATNNSGPCVSACLDSLAQQHCSKIAEIIVADCSTDGTLQTVCANYPNITLLHFDRPLGTPELLREGMKRAHGRIVAVTDAYCIFPLDWLEKLLRAHKAQFDVIGGAVEIQRPNGLATWAFYFADYAAFMLPNRPKSTLWLAGNHVSYKREILQSALASAEEGYWKVFIHWDLARQGVRCLFDPDLVAFYQRENTISNFAKDYFRHGRFFAAVRSKRISGAARLWHLITIPVLPILLLFQRLVPGLQNKRHRKKFLLTLPLVAVFVTLWSLGEFTGYLLGPARLPNGVYR